MKKNINWGMIGLGNIALQFAEAFKDSKNSKLKGIASNNPDKIRIFEKKFNIKKNYCFNSYEELLDCEDIDIVYIALPNSMHKEWIIKSINKKKNILVEKPAFMNLSETENIKKKIDNSKIFFTEGFMYRFTPQILKVVELLKTDVIKLRLVTAFIGNNPFPEISFMTGPVPSSFKFMVLSLASSAPIPFKLRSMFSLNDPSPAIALVAEPNNDPIKLAIAPKSHMPNQIKIRVPINSIILFHHKPIYLAVYCTIILS